MDSINVCRFVYNLWTDNGINYCNLADKFFNGEVDTLGLFIRNRHRALYNDDEGDNDNMHEVDKRDKDKLSYDGFVKEYMKVNEPCIITGLVKDWTAYKELNNNGIVGEGGGE